MSLYVILNLDDGSRAHAAQVPFKNPPAPGLLCIVRSQDGFLDPARFVRVEEREVPPPASEPCEFVSFATRAEAARAIGNAEALVAVRQKVLDWFVANTRDPAVLRLRWSNRRERLVLRVSPQSRTDVRELRQMLADDLRCALDIRLEPTRQIAAETGGVGSCGRPLCCALGIAHPEDSLLAKARSRDTAVGICNRPCCCLDFQ